MDPHTDTLWQCGWDCLPLAQMSEDVVPRRWNCLGRIGKYGLLGGGLSLWVRLCCFKSFLPSPVLSVCWFHDVSSQLSRPLCSHCPSQQCGAALPPGPVCSRFSTLPLFLGSSPGSPRRLLPWRGREESTGVKQDLEEQRGTLVLLGQQEGGRKARNTALCLGSSHDYRAPLSCDSLMGHCWRPLDSLMGHCWRPLGPHWLSTTLAVSSSHRV